MGLFLCSVESQRSTNMQLHIRGSSNYVLEFSGAESLAELKAKVGECHVDVTVPLMGGKVHGSLARAGKVRGQTPKVEAQEKKKKKTGRAKRRIQYNRRF